MSSGTAALQLALRLAGVQAGDFVIVPNLTFVASLNAICHQGGTPLLIDVDADTWQMDLDLLEAFLAGECKSSEGGSLFSNTHKRRIAAILPVHVLGNTGDMDRLLQLAATYGLPLVEDATEAIGTTFRGAHAGGFGLMGCLSFNANKLITTGGGGMILTHDAELARQARHLSTQAKLPGMDYAHDAIGYNCRMTALAAALGLAQVEQLPDFLARRRQIAALYRQALPELRFQQHLPEVDPNHWLTTVYVPDKETLLHRLLAKNIQCRPLWQPMNELPMFREAPYLNRHHVSRDLYAHCVSLPSSNGLSDAELGEVVSCI